MKKLIIAVLCTCAAVAANAQEKSVLVFGNLGGGASFQSNQNAPGNYQGGFNTTTGVGYQFSKRWTLGGEAMLNYSMLGQPPYQGSYNSHPYGISRGIGVFGRYTVPINNLFYFYTQADGMYIRGKTYDDEGSIQGSQTNTISLKLTPGIGLNIKNGYALNFGLGSLGVSHTTIPSIGISNTSFGYNVLQGFSIGMSKNFLHHTKTATAKTLDKEGDK